MNFDYRTAFSRNIGWVTELEQQRLRSAKVAVAGAGGVGGIHLLTLARLGIGKFHVADLDRFELANFNRQAGATVDTLGAEKAQIGNDLVKSVNPEAEVKVFDHGVTLENLDEFLDGVDVYIDGLDFFVLDIRAALFRRARELGITTITAAPLGMGTGYIIFSPDGMAFDDFFALSEQANTLDDYVGFLIGLTPRMMHRQYLADDSRVDMVGQMGPSTPIACQLCAGVAAAEALKVILGRGPSKAAPYYHHFDAYRNKFISRRLWFGANNPLQRVKRFAINKLVHGLSATARPKEAELASTDCVLDRILEAGRWAPSADNTQPWRFAIKDDAAFDVHVALDPANIYEYRAGEPVLLGVGMLLENMRLRALSYGLALTWDIIEEQDDKLIISCQLTGSNAPSDGLDHFIELRSVLRGPLSTQSLSDAQKCSLETALGDGYHVDWHESSKSRWAHSLLNARAALVRLRTPETVPIHQKIIDFENKFPRYGLAASGIGMDKLTQRLMRWALVSQTRCKWLINRLGGALWGTVEMDIVSGMFAGAHFTITTDAEKLSTKRTSAQMLEMGQGLQRFWLAASQNGLMLQPSCAPIAFAHYGRADTSFTKDVTSRKRAQGFAKRFEDFYAAQAPGVLFRGRLAHLPRKAGQSRSIRLPLDSLVVSDARGEDRAAQSALASQDSEKVTTQYDKTA